MERFGYPIMVGPILMLQRIIGGLSIGRSLNPPSAFIRPYSYPVGYTSGRREANLFQARQIVAARREAERRNSSVVECSTSVQIGLRPTVHKIKRPPIPSFCQTATNPNSSDTVLRCSIGSHSSPRCRGGLATPHAR